MLSLYIHIPFCERKCFYCSFAVVVGQQQRVDRYLDCLCVEMKRYQGEKIASVYIGGGTPTLLNSEQLGRMMCFIKENFKIAPAAEWTIETNPESLDPAKARSLKSFGITRLSLGIQSLNDRYLKYLGRNHDGRQALRAFHAGREAGFDNVNLDLMFSFPRQTVEEIERDVRAVMRLRSEHISLYMLHLEENSRFFVQGIPLPDDDVQAGQYQLTTALLEREGFAQYEISNFAKAGKESRHNLNYWQGGEYIGLGLGAHSYRHGKLFWNVSRFPAYLTRIGTEGLALDGWEQLDIAEQFKQALLIGLRMNQGVVIKNLEQRLGCVLKDEERRKIDAFVREGFLDFEKGRLKATARGRLVLDELCARMI